MSELSEERAEEIRALILEGFRPDVAFGGFRLHLGEIVSLISPLIAGWLEEAAGDVDDHDCLEHVPFPCPPR